jgi:O-antigen ligase
MNSEILEDYSRYCLVAMIIGLSVSTAGANLALAGFLVFAILSKRLQKDYFLIIKNPVALSSFGLFLILCLSVVWSEAGASVAWGWVSKYKKLLLIPLAAPFFQKRVHKLLFIKSLLVSLTIGLSISYLNYFGVTSIGGCPSYGCSTHTYITLAMLNSLLVIVSLTLFIFLRQFRYRFGAFVLMVLASFSIVVVLRSRTGQLMALCLSIWLPFLIWRSSEYYGKINKRHLLLYMGLFFALVAVGLGAEKGSRFSESIQKLVLYKQEALKSTDSTVAVDVRSEMYRKTVELIVEKPLLGWGAGGQEDKLLEMSMQGATENERFIFANPHNEYLSWMVQAGVLGFCALIFWLFTVWRHAFKIEDSIEKIILLGWLLIFTLGNMLNSFLLDFSEGYMTVLLVAVLAPLSPSEGKVEGSLA